MSSRMYAVRGRNCTSQQDGCQRTSEVSAPLACFGSPTAARQSIPRSLHRSCLHAVCRVEPRRLLRRDAVIEGRRLQLAASLELPRLRAPRVWYRLRSRAKAGAEQHTRLAQDPAGGPRRVLQREGERVIWLPSPARARGGRGAGERASRGPLGRDATHEVGRATCIRCVVSVGVVGGVGKQEVIKAKVEERRGASKVLLARPRSPWRAKPLFALGREGQKTSSRRSLGSKFEPLLQFHSCSTWAVALQL